MTSNWKFRLGSFLRRTRSEGDVLAHAKTLAHTKSLAHLGKKKLPSLVIDFPPEIEGKSEILSHGEIQNISGFLPRRIHGTKWQLVFSTSLDGFSLGNLYRKCQQEFSSPTLLCIEDNQGNVFGALLSCTIKLSAQFYGTGESFLFTSRPKFTMFPWSGENNHFTRGKADSLVIGAGKGKFGLWLDCDLHIGRSQACCTYNNDPLVDTGTGDFVVKTVECWAFQ